MQQEQRKQDEQAGRCTSTDGMLELDNLKLEPHRGSEKKNPPYDYDNSTLKHDDDLNQYDDDDDDDDDDGDGDGISSSYHSTTTASATNHQYSHDSSATKITYFLGRAFNPTTDRLAMHAFQKSLFWFTYRSDLVVPLRPYSNSSPLTAMKHPQLIGEHITASGGAAAAAGMKSDAGWGCMLRSAQMMLAQAVRRHYNPAEGSCNHIHRRAGDPSKMNESKSTRINERDDPWEAERIAQWFADFPNHANDDDDYDYDFDYNGSNHKLHDETTTERSNDNSSKIECPNLQCYGRGGINYHWYSLHQMVAAGIGLGVLPGEWYGPTTACHVLRELNEIHCDRREKLAKKLFTRTADGSDDAEPETARGYKHNSSEPTSAATVHSNNNTPTSQCDMFRVHISTEGCIYVDAILKLMTRSSSKSGGNDGGNDNEESNNPTVETKDLNDPLSPQVDEIDDPLRQSMKSQHHQDTTRQRGGTLQSIPDIVEWDTSLLLLLPLRLGIQNISTPDYGSTLAKLIAFPHSVGMLGGTPRHALWFYGADAAYPLPAPNSVGEKSSSSDQDCVVVGGWYGLDPHTVQLAPRGTRVLVEQSPSSHDISSSSNNKNKRSQIDNAHTATYQWQVQVTDTYLRSLHISPTASHPNNDRSIPLSKLDPSCALGFYIRDHADFVYFQHLVRTLSVEHCRPNKLPEIISVLEKTPNYAMDVSSAIKDMIGRQGAMKDEASTADDLEEFSIKSEQEDGAKQDNTEDDDDDDFVLV